MIPNTKISETILKFGKSLILSLPDDATKEEYEAAIALIITAWNAVVIDSWNKNSAFETQVLATLPSLPIEGQIEMKRLLKRKKKKFSTDLRAVGKHWVREENGQFIFGCEARLGVENIPASSTNH